VSQIRGDLNGLSASPRDRGAASIKGRRNRQKFWISKENANISKVLFGGSRNIKGLRLVKIWIPQAFPNFCLAEIGNIKGLQSKKFGKC
jgi:hypothetical protein